MRAAPQKKFFDRLSSEQKAYELYPGFKHAIFHEAERSRPIQRAREFILQAFQSPVDRTPLQDAAGYTRQELERLSRPASPLKRAGYALTRGMMKSMGRLSDGIRLGWDRGFSSGEILDYVYANHPRGSLFLGGMIDRSYLDAVGWKGIRIRGEHLQVRLQEAIHTQLETQGSVRIVDLAAGAGRYVLNILDRNRDCDLSATLCDQDTTALERGRSRSAYLGLKNVAWTQSDAFDPEKVRSLSAGAGIAIVSGLYELFSDNALVRRSLCALHEGLAPGGLLIYTGQPWHPQLEFIARTLTHQDGSPWRMRRRTQAELDEVVRAAGFDKQGMDIDHYGIFTVSVARKVG